MLKIIAHTPRLLCRSAPFSMSPSAFKDPWPLPHTPEHLESTKTPRDIPHPIPLQRPNESIETMRARLVYQSRKRGTLESDLLLSTFARDVLEGMDENELREYDKVRPLMFNAILLWVSYGRPSYLMNLIGIYTTGQRTNGSLLNDGQTHQFSRDSDYMRRMKARSLEACLLYRSMTRP